LVDVRIVLRPLSTLSSRWEDAVTSCDQAALTGTDEGRAPSREECERSPTAQTSLLVLDNRDALPGDDEERLLVRLGVVEAGLPGSRMVVNPELSELDRRIAVLVPEARRASPLCETPFGVEHVLSTSP